MGGRKKKSLSVSEKADIELYSNELELEKHCQSFVYCLFYQEDLTKSDFPFPVISLFFHLFSFSREKNVRFPKNYSTAEFFNFNLKFCRVTILDMRFSIIGLQYYI